MNTIIPRPNLLDTSWAEDYTHSRKCRQQFLYIQAIGYYAAMPSYGVMNRSGLHSTLLLYTVSGRGGIEYQNREADLPAGSAAIVNCDLPHSYFCRPGGNWEFYWLHFSGESIEGYLSEILDNWNVVELPGLQPRLEKLIGLVRSYDANNEIRCSTELIDLCSEVLLKLRSESNRLREETSPIIHTAITYLEEHFEQEISLEELCSYLNISKYYFAHFFKQQTGSSPYEYLINIRITHSKSMLRGTNDTVAEIAERAGFSNSSYFIQTFRAREGLTPLKYRNYFLQMQEN
jgi:AraC-like DNA-binding protein